MGLDLLPRPCPCGLHGNVGKEPEGYTHLEAAPCPFASSHFPIGMLATCCSLRGKVAAAELDAFGERAVAARMFEHMSAETALAFARTLRQAADRIEAKHANDNPKPRGAGQVLRLNAETGESSYDRYSTFEEALAFIRQAADWYGLVASLGYGVYAWF